MTKPSRRSGGFRSPETTEMATRPKRRTVQEPRTLPLPPPGYQPSKAELEEEIDMPGLSDEEVRERFFRPFRFVREQPDG